MTYTILPPLGSYYLRNPSFSLSSKSISSTYKYFIISSIYNFIYVFICGSVGSSLLCGLFLQLQQAGAPLQLRHVGFSLRGLLLLWSTGSRAHRLQQMWHAGSAVVIPGLQSTCSVVEAHWLSCSLACGVSPDYRSNPCLLHWLVDSLPLSHQGSPLFSF